MHKFETSKSNQGIQVISRAVAILRSMKGNKEGLSLSQIATAVDLPRSTVQRITNAMLLEGLVIKSSPQGGYRLGPEIQMLAAAGRIDIVDIVRPHITALSRETGETVDLAEFRQDHMVFVDQSVGTHRLRAVATVGEEFPLICTANGKACLALLDDQNIADLAEHEFQSGKVKRSALSTFMNEIEEIRLQGFAYDLGEHTDGVSAVGAAFIDLDQRIYAISIPVPTHRFIEKQTSLTKSLEYTLEGIKALFKQ